MGFAVALGLEFLGALGHGSLAAEADPALFVDADAFDPDDIAHLDDVFGGLDPEIGELADVDEAVLAGEDFDEGAEFLDGDDLASVDLADLDFGGDGFDAFAGDAHAFGVDREDHDRAVVLDVDFATRAFDEGLDVLAAGPDDRADLLRVDAEADDAGGVLAHLGARGREHGFHGLEDIEARDAGILDGLGEDLDRKALELEIELEARDPLLSACDLAVHVAEVVFPPDDVGEELVAGDLAGIVVLGADADADAADRTFDGNTGVHEGQGARTDCGHGGRAVRLEHFARDPDRVGVFLQGQHWLDAAFGEGAVADFAAAGAHDATCLADREMREAVVEKELLLGRSAGVGVEFLDVVRGPECDRGEGLGLATREHGRAVGAGEEADFAADGADGGRGTAVEAFSFVQDEAADGFLLDVVEGVLDDELVDLFGSEQLLELVTHLGLDGLAGGFAGKLARVQQGVDDAAADEFLGRLEDVVGDDVRGDLALGLADLGREFLLRRDQRLDGFLPETEGGDEVRFRKFVGGAFEHHGLGLVADVEDVDVALLTEFVGGIGDELATDATNTHGANGTGPGDVADEQRRGGAVRCEHVRIVLAIRTEKDGLDLNLIEPTLREEGPDGAVDDSGCEDFLFGRATFAFEETPGEAAGRSGPFAVIDCEREEFLTGPGLCGGDGGDDHDGLAELYGDGSVGLFGQLSGFDNNALVANLGDDFLCHGYNDATTGRGNFSQAPHRASMRTLIGHSETE